MSMKTSKVSLKIFSVYSYLCFLCDGIAGGRAVDGRAAQGGG